MEKSRSEKEKGQMHSMISICTCVCSSTNIFLHKAKEKIGKEYTENAVTFYTFLYSDINRKMGGKLVENKQKLTY